MDNDVLWSLRLGFTAGQAQEIKNAGIREFSRKSVTAKYSDPQLPFIINGPKTRAALKEQQQAVRNLPFEEKKKYNEKLITDLFSLKGWSIKAMAESDYPLREKMALFWQNHFVVAHFKVKHPYTIYTHNKILRDNAFGNLRELTKKAIRTNGMLGYLDGAQNKKGAYNENLSRELLELFTLGPGNYTEQDIKNGAKGLAGLVPGDGGAIYNDKFADKEPFTYLGKTGSFDSDAMVDVIFAHPKAPYHITRKLLKWFIYDNPPEELVTYYGNYLRDNDYELTPLLEKMFTDEYPKPTAGSKIKDPLIHIVQVMSELNITATDYLPVAVYLRTLGMDLYNQPNVKGWDGGHTWLTAQSLQVRNNIAEQLCKGKNFTKSYYPAVFAPADNYTKDVAVKLKWDRRGNNKDVIAELRERLLFTADTDLQADFEELLKYDFDPRSQGADNGVMRLFNFMVKTPEFQIL